MTGILLKSRTGKNRTPQMLPPPSWLPLSFNGILTKIIREKERKKELKVHLGMEDTKNHFFAYDMNIEYSENPKKSTKKLPKVIKWVHQNCGVK